MALTKDKLVMRLQAQLGITKPDSRQMVERLFGLIKDSPMEKICSSAVSGEGDRIILKVSQLITAQRVREGDQYLKNEAYLKPAIFIDQFYEPAANCWAPTSPASSLNNNVIASCEGGVIGEDQAEAKAEAGIVKKPPISLKDIVEERYVVRIECSKKLKTLKAHLRKAHCLMAREYFLRYNLDIPKYPLGCREYSEQRSVMAKNRGFSERGTHNKATS